MAVARYKSAEASLTNTMSATRTRDQDIARVGHRDLLEAQTPPRTFGKGGKVFPQALGLWLQPTLWLKLLGLMENICVHVDTIETHTDGCLRCSIRREE